MIGVEWGYTSGDISLVLYGVNFHIGGFMYRVRYLPLGVKNVQQKIIYISQRDVADFGDVEAAAKYLGCLRTDVISVEGFDSE